MDFTVRNYITSYQSVSEKYGTCVPQRIQESQSSQSGPDLKARLERRRMLTSQTSNADKAEEGYQKKTFQASSKSVVDSSVDYTKTLQAQRAKIKDTSLQKKKVKYQFKNLSSKIMRSKTSASARQVVSQARREIAKLKRQRTDADIDKEELEAAITHAEAMERVAKKKVRHLEEEEMARAKGGFGIGSDLSDEDLEDKDIQDGSGEDNLADDIREEEFLGQNTEELNSDLQEEYVEIAKDNMESYEMPDTAAAMSSFDMSDMISQISEFTAEMTEEMSQSMTEMLNEMGLDEMNDALMAYSGDMSPEDLKEMVIKHRNKELKEMTEADSEYLKAIFDHYQKMTETPVISSGPTPSIPEALSQVVPTGSVDIAI